MLNNMPVVSLNSPPLYRYTRSVTVDPACEPTQSLSLVLSTLPIVWASERFGWTRRGPLLGGMCSLAASLVMFMLAPNYAVFVIARSCHKALQLHER